MFKVTLSKFVLLVIVICLVSVSVGMADVFGFGTNQFEIDFVSISGDSNPDSGRGIVNYDYRMGMFEITNDQWNKFVAINDKPTGNPSDAYDQDSYFTGLDVPVNNVSWYEAARFVNWLDEDAGYAKAYNLFGSNEK